MFWKTHQTTISRILQPGWAVIGAALALVVTGIPAGAQPIPGVNVYPAVPGLPASTNYSVRVCAASNPSVWTNVFTFQTSVPANPDTNYVYYSSVYGWSHSYVNFEMTVPVTVEISNINGSITNVAVHPARKASNVYVSGGKAYFTLNNPCNVAVDINGQMDSRETGNHYSGPPIHTISIHGNPVLANKPATNDPSVYLVTPGTTPPQTGSWTTLYFLPGVYTLGTDFQLYSGKNYYIPGDALVYASFNNDLNGSPGNNIRMFGHGTISGSQFYHNKYQPVGVDVRAINIQANNNGLNGDSNVRVEGITIVDPANHSLMVGSWTPQAGVTNVVSWVKMFTWRPNGDGGGYGYNNIVTNNFYRTQDDGLYVNSSPGYAVRENVFWTDVNGTPFRLSFLPNTASLYDNNDVIYSRSTWWSHSSALTFPGDTGNHGNGVIFSNLVVSDPFPDGPAISISPDTNGVFSGTRFANVTVATPINSAGNLNQLNATKPGTSIHDLTFDNLVIGGVLVTPNNWQNYFTTNGNVYNIFFTASGTPPPDALPRTGWVATASASGGGSAANAIDSDNNTRWSPGADQANGQWFQVDMSSPQTFNRIVMDAGISTNDYPRGYQVTVSNDGTNWSSAVASGTGSNAVITVTFATQTARYIRVTQTGSVTGTGWSLYEFYVYPPAIIVLPRTGWVASASASGGGSAANAIDGNSGSRWSPGVNQANGQYFQVDMGSTNTFSQIVLDAGGAASDYPRGYQVKVSNDGLNWGSAVATGAGSSAVTTINFAPQTARYIRVTQTGSSSANWWSIYEFNVYSAIPTTYTLTRNTPNGTVTLNPAWPTYPAGTVVTVTAVPNAGYVFNNWSGGLSGSANPTTLTMATNSSVTANYSASSVTYTLTTASPNGTVTLNPPGSTYPVNTVVSVTAVPNAGSVFNNWSGDLAGSANPTTITMSANKSITANIDYPVLPRTGWVAIASSGGSPNNSIDGNISTRWSTGASQTYGQWFQVDMGSVQTFNRIVMDASGSAGDYPRGYQVNVSNDGSNWGSPVATGTGSAVTTITFAPQTARYIRVTQTGSVSGIWWSIHEFNVYGLAYTLTETSPNGTVTFNPLGPTYFAGTVVTVTAVPDSGYVFNGWSGDLAGSVNPTTITLTTNKSIVANSIATNALTLTGATMGPGGGLSFSITNTGGIYRVQVNTNLANAAGWVTISTNTAPFTYTVTNVPGGTAQGFYRVVTP